VRNLRDYLTLPRILTMVGVALLLAWAAEWTISVQRNRMVGAEHTWVPAFAFLGVDFQSNYFAARHWLAGGDPYTEPFDDPLGRPIVNPPPILPLFAWTSLFSVRWAVAIWIAILAGFATFGAWAAWRTRRRLGLDHLPLPLVAALLLCSTPVLFALERGNWDLMLMPPLVGLAWGLRERSLRRDGVAGLCLTLMAWLKMYPAFLVIAPLALKRFRAVAIFVVASAILTIVYWPQLHAMAATIRTLEHRERADLCHVLHSWSQAWRPFWHDTPLEFLTRIPGAIAAFALMLPLVFFVSRRVALAPDSRLLLFPYLCWLAAAATCLPRVMNDYNFFFLPLVLLATWDRRDSFVVHMLLALCLFWWQPFIVNVGPRLFFACKVAGFGAATISLWQRASEGARSTSDPSRKTWAGETLRRTIANHPRPILEQPSASPARTAAPVEAS
jgi:hypothetical protein